MDPATAIQLVSAISGIVQTIYSYGTAVKDASSEITQLRSELFALKAALEHIAWSIDGRLAGDSPVVEIENDASGTSHPSDKFDKTTGEQRLLQRRGSDATTLVERPKDRGTQSPFLNPLLETEESVNALKDAQKVLTKLQDALKKPGATLVSRLMQSATWPIKRSETLQYAKHLQSISSYFVLATTTDNLRLCKEIYAEIQGIREDIEARHLATEEKGLREATRQWLSACTPHAILETALSERQYGTGSWFSDGIFYPWQYSGVPVLWLRGKPGSGKTTLTSLCIDETERQSSGSCHAYFFCSVNDPGSQELVNILGSFILQLCEQYPGFWYLPEQCYQRAMIASKSSLKRAEIKELEEMLNIMIGELRGVSLFLDAPNECSDADTIIKSVMDLVHEHESTQIMISSTEDIQPAIVKHSLSSPQVIEMSNSEVEHDIGAYINAHLDKNKKLRGLSQNIKNELREALLHRADGSFRWVQCQVDYLTRSRSLREIRLAIQQVPPTLNDTYVAILAGISASDQSVLRKMLLFLTFAVRNLTLQEATEAAVFGTGVSDTFTEARLLTPIELVKCAGSLVRYDPETDLLALAHSSVRTFLTSDAIKASSVSAYYLDPITCAADITVDCIEYLCLPVFQSGYCNTTQALNQRLAAWPLAKYAATFWTRHTKLAIVTSSAHGDDAPAPVQHSLDAFFATAENHHGGCFSAWYELAYPDGNANLWRTKPLYFAAREGLVSIAQSILSSESGMEQLEMLGGRRSSTPLHVAATYGRLDMVKLLLEYGANPNERNAYGESGLQWAHVYRNLDVQDVLLAAGADPSRLELASYESLKREAQDDLDEACLTNAYHKQEKWQKKRQAQTWPGLKAPPKPFTYNASDTLKETCLEQSFYAINEQEQADGTQVPAGSSMHQHARLGVHQSRQPQGNSPYPSIIVGVEQSVGPPA